MRINGNAVRPGMVIEHQGRLWRAVKIQHTQPGKGGAYLQVELKDIRDGTKLNERFRSSENVERVRLDQKEFQFLYGDGDMFTFMDTETYDQVSLNKDLIGEDQLAFLQDGMNVHVESFENEPISVQAARDRGPSRSPRPTPSSRAKPPPPPTSPRCWKTASGSWFRLTSKWAPGSLSIRPI